MAILSSHVSEMIFAPSLFRIYRVRLRSKLLARIIPPRISYKEPRCSHVFSTNERRATRDLRARLQGPHACPVPVRVS